jgi:NADH-quinone oxidoreductase subunit L
VIHAVGTQDIRQMGGVRKVMPITFATMLIASLALAGFGIPGTSIGVSGFFSKDPIIEAAYLFGESTENWLPYLFSIVAALLTSIYIFRLIFMTFTGKPRTNYKGHESPSVMTVPLMILGVLALVFGALTKTGFGKFLEETFANNFVNMDIHALAEIGKYHLASHGGEGEPLLILWMPVIVAVAGLLISYLIYGVRIIDMSSIVSRKNPVYKLLYNRYYQNAIFTQFISVKIVYEGLALAGRAVDRGFDWLVNLIGQIFTESSDGLRQLQTGVVQNYATSVVTGVSLLIILVKLILEVF